MSQKYSISVPGSDKKEELQLDPANKLNPGDNVSLKDGKKAKVKSVTLNVASGNYDVELDEAQDANKPRVIDAEGNDPNPYSKAVKDVVLDPKFTPAVTDPTRPASENAAEAAGDVQTGGSRAATDKRVDGAPAKAPAKDAKDGSKDLSKTDAIRRHAQPVGSPGPRPQEST